VTKIAAMKTAAALLALAVIGPVAAEAAPMRDRAMAQIGETVRVHRMRVTPLRVLEDSRCPQNVRCIWGGQVRLSVRIDGATRELTLGKPVAVSGGQLRLAAVAPEIRSVGHRIPPRAYRFGFEFTGEQALELISHPPS
jgi:hypothetical protein